MAIWRNPYVTWGGQNISGSVRSASVQLGAEGVDDTAGGAFARSAASGLKTLTVAMELNWSSTGSNGIDDLFGSTSYLAPGGTGALVIRPTTSAIAATNPQYTATMRVAEYQFGGAIGDQHVASVSLENAGTNITRAVST